MLSALKMANLALAFFLELAALVAFAYWGFTSSSDGLPSWLLGIGTPLLAAVLWGIWEAPKSARRLRGAAYLIFKIAFFALAWLALFAANQSVGALVLAVLTAINIGLGYLWHQE